jgi:hypothetical protein
MNNWCICWFFMHIFSGILIFKGLTARRLYKSFGLKGLITCTAGSWRAGMTCLLIHISLTTRCTKRHGVPCKETWNFINIAMTTSELTLYKFVTELVHERWLLSYGLLHSAIRRSKPIYRRCLHSPLSGNDQQSRRCHVPEDSKLQNLRQQNRKYHWQLNV